MAYNTQVISDVIDFTVERYDTTKRGDILFHVDYASETSINSTAERMEITGGIGNYSIASIDHSAKATFTAKLPLVDLMALGEKLGKAVSVGSKVATYNKIYEVIADTITLDEVPFDAANVAGAHQNEYIRVYKVLGDRDMGQEIDYAVAGGVAADVTLDSSIIGDSLDINSVAVGEDYNDIKFVLTVNTGGTPVQNDVLEVTYSGDTVTVNLAATTIANNAAANIQAAIQALGITTLSDGRPIDFTGFTATAVGGWDATAVSTAGAPATYMANGYDATGAGKFGWTGSAGLTPLVLDLNPGDWADGDKIFVTHEYNTGGNTKELKITGNNFPGFIRITGRGYVTDDIEGELVPIAFEVKKAKVQPSFDLTMASNSPTEVDFTCDCFAVQEGCDKVFIEILRLDDETYGC